MSPVNVRHLAVAAALCVFVGLPASAASQVDSPALDLRTLAGADVSLADFRGEVVVVNFWATWCIPCRKELPLFEAVARAYEGREVRFIAASADDASTQLRIPEAISQAGLTFDVWIGATTLDMTRFDVGTQLPATVVIGRDGAVSSRIRGVVTEEQLRAHIDAALGDRPTPGVAEAAEDAPHDECCDHGHEAHADGGVGFDPDDADASADSHDHDHEHDHEHEHASAAVNEADASLVPS